MPTVPLSRFPAERIALIKPSALGDIVHSLPVLSALRQRYPDAHITWIVNRSYEPLLRGHSDLNATLPFDRAAVRAGLLGGAVGFGRFFQQLRRSRFDLVIDLQGLLRTGLMTAASGARRRVGLSTAREGAAWFYTDVIPVADLSTIHAVDRYWLVAEALGAGDGPKRFHLPIPEADRRWAGEALQNLPRPWLMLAAGARWVTKRWPPEHFADLAGRAQLHFGGSVVFVGGKEESALAQRVVSRLRGPGQDLTGRTTLPQLAAVLARADAMLGNDSGPLHLAVALGRPAVAPYTCTKVSRTGPYGTPANGVETRVWCQGSYLKQCDRLECMAELTSDRLWPVLNRILIAWQSNRLSA